MVAVVNPRLLPAPLLRLPSVLLACRSCRCALGGAAASSTTRGDGACVASARFDRAGAGPARLDRAGAASATEAVGEAQGGGGRGEVAAEKGVER
eukprot:scaffold91369_cov23-Tisochrysis_lutea.AAC.2